MRAGSCPRTTSGGNVSTVTSASSRRSSSAVRSPTGPTPITAAWLPFSSTALRTIATAAAAVVLEPSESSMIDGLNGSKNSFRAASNTASPSRTFDPPTQNAVLARPSGPRGNTAPWTTSSSPSAVIAPKPRTTSTPAS